MALNFTNGFRQALDNAFINAMTDFGLNLMGIPPGLSIANVVSTFISDGLGNLTMPGVLTAGGLTVNGLSAISSTIKSSTFVECYVHPNGNDANTGVDWNNAMASVYGAYKSALTSGKFVKIYVHDGSNLYPGGTGGLWLTTDSAVYTGSPTWLQATPCLIEGVGGYQSQFSRGGQARVTSPIGGTTPALRLYGANGVTIRNLVFSDRAELNCDTNSNPGIADSHAVNNCRFENCAFVSYNQAVTNGWQPWPALTMGFGIWDYFDHCSFTAALSLNRGLTMIGTILSAAGAVATLHYPEDAASFVPGLKVLVGSTQRTVNSVNAVGGVVTFDSATGVSGGEQIFRYQTNEAYTLSGNVASLTAGEETKFMVGDKVRDISDLGEHYVTAIDTVGHTLTFDSVAGWPSSGTLFLLFSPNVGQPQRAAVLLVGQDPRTVPSPAVCFFRHTTTENGGLTYYSGAGDWGIEVDDLIMEGNFSDAFGPAVQVVGANAYGHTIVDNVFCADTPASYPAGSYPLAGTPVPDLLCKSLLGTIIVPDAVISRRTEYIVGPAITEGQILTRRQTPLSLDGQVGFFGGRVHAVHDGARRAGGPVVARAVNAASSNTADFFSATATVTPNVADPFGGTNAFRITRNGAGNVRARIVSQTGTVNAGETLIIGVWSRGDGNTVAIGEQLGTGNSISVQKYPQGDGNWTWSAGYLSLTGSGSDTVFMDVICEDVLGETMDFFGPVFVRIPAGAMSPSEITEYAQHLAQVPSNCPATACSPMGDLALPRHLVTFQPSPQTNTHPSIAAGANLGTSPTVSVVGTDTAGTISITTGTGSSTGLLATITFALAFAAAPHVKLQATNTAAAALLQTYPTKTASTFALNTLNALIDSTTYTWDYLVVG